MLHVVPHELHTSHVSVPVMLIPFNLRPAVIPNMRQPCLLSTSCSDAAKVCHLGLQSHRVARKEINGRLLASGGWHHA